MPWETADKLGLLLRSLLGQRVVKPIAAVADVTNLSVPVDLEVGTRPVLPVVLLDNFTFWPLSFSDGRVSLDIVVTYGTDPSVLNSFEVAGARDILQIFISYQNETAIFYGDSNTAATVGWDVLASATAAASIAAGISSPTSSSSISPSPSPSLSSSTSSASSSSSPSLSPFTDTSPIAGGIVGGLVFFLIVAILFLRWLWPSIRTARQRRRDVEENARDPRRRGRPDSPRGRSETTRIPDNVTVVSEPAGADPALLRAWAAGVKSLGMLGDDGGEQGE